MTLHDWTVITFSLHAVILKLCIILHDTLQAFDREMKVRIIGNGQSAGWLKVEARVRYDLKVLTGPTLTEVLPTLSGEQDTWRVVGKGASTDIIKSEI